MGTAKWLGRKVRFYDPNEIELSNRIAAAWGAFTKFKTELTDRQYCINDRLKLFNAVVTSTMLYGCEAWTLRIDQQRRVRAVQRKMLRLVLNAKRQRVQLDGTSQESNDGIEAEEDEEQLLLLEPWPDFLWRTARWSEEHLKAAGQKEWLTIWRARQWNWATRLVNDDSQKWSATATQWQPPLHCRKPSGRLQARPRKRWEQDLVDFLAFWKPGSRETWQELAARPSEWERLKDAFVNYTCHH